MERKPRSTIHRTVRTGGSMEREGGREGRDQTIEGIRSDYRCRLGRL